VLLWCSVMLTVPVPSKDSLEILDHSTVKCDYCVVVCSLLLYLFDFIQK